MVIAVEFSVFLWIEDSRPRTFFLKKMTNLAKIKKKKFTKKKNAKIPSFYNNLVAG